MRGRTIRDIKKIIRSVEKTIKSIFATNGSKRKTIKAMAKPL